MDTAKKLCLSFMSDAAAENKAFAKELNNEGFRFAHVTCAAHGLNNVTQLLPGIYTNIHDLVTDVKSIYSKSPNRREKWKELNKKIRLPPKFCKTRWNSWIEAVGYFSKKKKIEKQSLKLWNIC